MNKRKIKLREYGISKKRYMELVGFCGQYPEWKEAIRNHVYISGVGYDSVRSNTNSISDTTGKAAIKLSRIQGNVDMIEKIARTVEPDYWKAIIDVVCYDASPMGIISKGELPMSKSAFYERRVYFFYLLDIEKRKIENAENMT